MNSVVSVRCRHGREDGRQRATKHESPKPNRPFLPRSSCSFLAADAAVADRMTRLEIADFMLAVGGIAQYNVRRTMIGKNASSKMSKTPFLSLLISSALKAAAYLL